VSDGERRGHIRKAQLDHVNQIFTLIAALVLIVREDYFALLRPVQRCHGPDDIVGSQISGRALELHRGTHVPAVLISIHLNHGYLRR
jgi:hypothetical protein